MQKYIKTTTTKKTKTRRGPPVKMSPDVPDFLFNAALWRSINVTRPKFAGTSAAQFGAKVDGKIVEARFPVGATGSAISTTHLILDKLQ